MTALGHRARLAIWRARHAMWGWRHYRVCGNCRYWGRDCCWQHGWDGDLIDSPGGQPGCERWRRLHEEPERP